MLSMLSLAAAWPDVPHFDGIFLNLNDATAAWTKEQWVTDFNSMKAVGMTFFCVAAGRSGMWANIELFGQSTVASGPAFPGNYYCHNCVGKWERVRAQLALESSLPHVTKRIAWEWTGCLSPNYGPEGPNTSKALYAEYKAYIDAGVAAA